MGVFYILIFTPMLIQIISVKGIGMGSERVNKRALVVFFILFSILLMFRNESVGNDTRNYINYFNEISVLSWKRASKVSLEIGFIYLNKIVSIFTDEAQVFLAITSIIMVVLIYPIYKRLCCDISLTVTLFAIMSTFVVSFSGIRQMLAVGIGCIGYYFTRNNKLLPFILSVVLAIFFHTSAFVLVLMYPVYHAKITKRSLYVIVPFVFVVYIFNKQIFSFMVSIMERFTKYEGEISQTGAYTMLVLFIIFVVFSFVIPDETLLDKETVGLRNIMILSVIFQMFAPLHTLAMRMNYYYIIYIPLLLPKIIKYRSQQWNQIAIVARYVMVVFFTVYFFYTSTVSDALHVFPYHFFWE